MTPLDAFLSSHLARGRLHFTREELLRAFSASSNTLTASLSKLARKGRIANPRPGFYLILTPQDREAGRHRIEFIAQPPNAFARTNRGEWLAEMKTDSGTAKAAGIELTLLDCANWFHRAGGISAVGSIARELGGLAGFVAIAILVAIAGVAWQVGGERIPVRRPHRRGRDARVPDLESRLVYRRVVRLRLRINHGMGRCSSEDREADDHSGNAVKGAVVNVLGLAFNENCAICASPGRSTSSASLRPTAYGSWFTTRS